MNVDDALSYLVIFSGRASLPVVGLCVASFLASNIVLMRLPERVTALAICRVQQDLFFLFFFAVFPSALGDRLELTAIAALLAGAAYLALLFPGSRLNPAVLLRVPFLFVTSLMYG